MTSASRLTEPCYFVTVDPDTREVGGQGFDAHDRHNCHGGWHGYCGGCDSCLMMQATHSGWELKRVEMREFETLGDAVGRMQHELGSTTHRETTAGRDRDIPSSGPFDEGESR